jgi:hypothetical protein
VTPGPGKLMYTFSADNNAAKAAIKTRTRTDFIVSLKGCRKGILQKQTDHTLKLGELKDLYGLSMKCQEIYMLQRMVPALLS